MHPSNNGESAPEKPALPIVSTMKGLRPDASTMESPTPSPADLPVQPPVHLRVFTNVALQDADMLFPGAVAVFTLFDQLLIWVPVLIGVVSAIYKISTSVWRH